MEPGNETTSQAGSRRWQPATIPLLLVAVLAVGLAVGYAAGSSGSDVEHLVGRAAVGDEIASIQVDDVFYGLDGLVPWIDSDGSVHEGDWPACLELGQMVTVQCGGQLVTLPTGSGEYRVAYVDCRPVE
jgi:hypothetical protein